MDLAKVEKIWKELKAETIEEFEDLFTSFKEGFSDKSSYRKAKTLGQIITIIVIVVFDIWIVVHLLSKLF